jgi:purine-binding chemotaxis protein CheW
VHSGIGSLKAKARISARKEHNMSNHEPSAARPHEATLQLATFYVDALCLALEIDQIQEILRTANLTHVPYAPQEVVGVINLRGEVTTVIDLRLVLGMPPAPSGVQPRTLIVRSQGESIGLMVDRVADIMTVTAKSIVPPPPNVASVDGRFLRGVYPKSDQIIVVLDLEATLSASSPV